MLSVIAFCNEAALSLTVVFQTDRRENNKMRRVERKPIKTRQCVYLSLVDIKDSCVIYCRRADFYHSSCAIFLRMKCRNSCDGLRGYYYNDIVAWHRCCCNYASFRRQIHVKRTVLQVTRQ